MPIAGLVTAAQIWTTFECYSGTPATGVIAVEEWEIWERIESQLVRRTLTLTLPLHWEQAAEVIARRVVRLYAKDGSTAEYDEFRIRDVEEDVGRNRIRIVAEGYEDDLFTSDALISQTVNNIVSYEPISEAQTPSAALTSWVDAFLSSVWAVGTVTPSATMETIQFGYDTPGSAAQKIAAAAALATGVTYEISVRRNGTTQLLIDLTVYASAATTPEIRSRKNLIGFNRRKTSVGQTTRAYARSGMRHPHYKVSAVSAGAYIEVVDLNGTGPGPAREDDQFNTTFYWYERKNGTSHQITDVVKVSYGTTRLHMASTATINVNDIGYIAGNSSGDVVGAVDSPSLQTSWGKMLGILDGDGDGYTNHLANNPDLRDGATPPTGWTETGTITYETTAGLFLRGGRSAKMALNGVANTLESTAQTIQCAINDVYTYQLWLYLGATAPSINTILIDLWDPQAGAYVTYDQYASGPADLQTRNAWIEFVRSFTITSAGAKTFRVRFRTAATTTTPYMLVDSAQIVKSSSALPWRRGCGSAASLAAINRHFDTNGAPLATYQAELDDLYVVDPTTYDADKLGLGVTGNFSEGTLAENRTALRITEVRRSGKAPRRPSVVLSSRRSRASTLLTT